MTAAIVGIVGALLGTLMGVLLTGTIERRNESKRWVRGATTEAYGAFIAQLQTVRMDVRRLAHTAADDPAREALEAAHIALWTPYNAALVDVEMYGSPAVYRHALEADIELRAISARARRAEIDDASWHDVRQPTDRAMRAAIDQIRAELHLPPQQDRETWVTRNATGRATGHAALTEPG